MSLRSPLGRVLGLGSAKSGTAHWWGQRVSAIALIPLSLRGVIAAAAMSGLTRAKYLVKHNPNLLAAAQRLRGLLS